MTKCEHCEREIRAEHHEYWWCANCQVAYCTVACIGCLCSGIEKR